MCLKPSASSAARVVVMAARGPMGTSTPNSRNMPRKALMRAEKRVSYIEIEANQGHDAFLIPIQHYMNVFTSHMGSIAGYLDQSGAAP